MSSRAADRRKGVAALALVVAFASGCGAGATPAASSDTAAAPATTTAARAATSTSTADATSTAASTGDPMHRPEGAWTLVSWTIKRSDSKVTQPIASVILGTLKPSCPSGPCDLTLTPAGAGGTYREPEAPPAADADPSTKPVELRWEGKSYVGRSAPRVVSCTPQVGGASLAGGYQTKSTLTLTFAPPSGNTPAGVHGTIAVTNTGTKAGKGKGCTDFTEIQAIAGSPSTSVDQVTPLQGTYDASMSATGSTPKSLAPVGRGFWLGPMTASGATAARTLTGLTSSAAPLAMADDGWAGNAPSASTDCQGVDGSVTKKGADGLESFSGIHPVALTEGGTPIFAGVWKLRTNANAVGLKAGCSLTRWEGRLILLPHGAGL